MVRPGWKRSGQPDREYALRRSATRPSELNDVRDAHDAAGPKSTAEPDGGGGVRGRRRGAQRRRPAGNECRGQCEKQRSYRSRPVLHSGLTRGCLHGRKPLERRLGTNRSARRKSPGTGSETSVTRALLVGSAAPPGAALTRVSGEGRGHMAAKEERVAYSQPPEDRTATACGESSRAGQADDDGSQDRRR